MIPALPYPPWQEHPDDRPIIAANVGILLAELVRTRGSRQPFSLETPREWHTRIHAGCAHIPVAAYVGNYRGTPLPYIEHYEVWFGGGAYRGTPPAQVQAALAAMSGSLQTNLDELDAVMTSKSDVTREFANRIIAAAARHYIEWIRIHPFADGNGRTARLLINNLFLRYWQPIVLPGRPPPERAVLMSATATALAGDFRPLERFLKHRLVEALKNRKPKSTRRGR